MLGAQQQGALPVLAPPLAQVVVDKTDALQQWGACVAFAVVLALFTHGVTSEALGMGAGSNG